MRPTRAAAVLLAIASTCVPTPAASPTFDAASIQPSKPGAPPGTHLENGRFNAVATLFGLITTAWDLMPSREQTQVTLAGAPRWVSTDNYEIHAVAEGRPTTAQMRLLLQAMLADRFALKVHAIAPETDVLALTLDKPGVTGKALRPHSEGPPCPANSDTPGSRSATIGVFPPVCEQLTAQDRTHGAIRIGARNIPLAQIATLLTSLGLMDRPVVDQTGLTGNFDFTLEFTKERKGPPRPEPDPPADFEITTIQQALHEQLGLKVKAAKAPLPNLVIDHVQRPADN